MKILLRFIIVGALLLVLLVPLMMILGVIEGRERYRNHAITRVAQSYANDQLLTGPVRVLPWTERYRNETTGANGKVKNEILTREGYELHMPARLRVKGQLQPDERRIGLFPVPVYRLHARIHAEFDEADYPAKEGRSYGQPYLVLGIKDVRGLVGTPHLRVDDQNTPPQAGTGVLHEFSRGGLRAALPALDNEQHGTLSAGNVVELELVLGGTHKLAIVPLADDTQVSLNSSWPHPLFGGSFLPVERSVSDTGFEAHWAISSLASTAQTQLLANLKMGRESIEVLDVQLSTPVDVYTQTGRAAKYGILFILLTFVGFALFELIKNLRIHPLQYLMVGLALTIFFLLLLSLSEHITFWQAYMLSAAACIGLQGFYLSGVLSNSKHGLTFSAILSVLYAVLYVILISESNALMMGTLLLFSILTAIMWITRKVDWYNIVNWK